MHGLLPYAVVGEIFILAGGGKISQAFQGFIRPPKAGNPLKGGQTRCCGREYKKDDLSVKGCFFNILSDNQLYYYDIYFFGSAINSL